MRFLPFLLAAVLAQPLAAETRQHGNVVFDLPTGWAATGTRDDGTLELRPDLPDDECEYCVIYVTPGEKTGGRADTWLAGQTRRFIDPDDTTEIIPLVAPELVSTGGRPSAMLGQKVDSDLHVLFAVQLFGRMELIGFKASAYDEEDLAEGMRVFERDVMPLLEGARFVSEGAPPLMPAPEPGDRSGVWWGTSTWWSMGLDGMMTMQIDHHWLTFWPDGTFYSGTAPQGVLPFDQAERLALGDMDWGVYRAEGDRLILTYVSGEVMEYAINGDGLVQGDRTLYPIELMPDGTKINGMVSTFFYSGFTPGSGISGGVSAATETHFHPDGTWDFGSSSGAFGSFDAGGGFATSGGKEAAGTYEVKGGLVIRRDDKGAVVGSAYVYKSGSDIWIGSEALATGG
jgi:hypothetical protein